MPSQGCCKHHGTWNGKSRFTNYELWGLHVCCCVRCSSATEGGWCPGIGRSMNCSIWSYWRQIEAQKMRSYMNYSFTCHEVLLIKCWTPTNQNTKFLTSHHIWFYFFMQQRGGAARLQNPSSFSLLHAWGYRYGGFKILTPKILNSVKLYRILDPRLSSASYLSRGFVA